jgi:hypothetical protein
MANGLLAPPGAGSVPAEMKRGHEPVTQWRCSALDTCCGSRGGHTVAGRGTWSGGVDPALRLSQCGELCCGERDCFELSGEDISITEAGYFVKSIRKTVPFSEAALTRRKLLALPMGGSRKCFFAPPPSI